MTPVTLTTILSTAPAILQAATRLIKTIREREKETAGGTDDIPTTLEGLKGEIRKLDARVHENFQSDVEQIRLIEQLAKQNETLAESLRRALRKVTVLMYVAVGALVLSLVASVLLVISR